MNFRKPPPRPESGFVELLKGIALWAYITALYWLIWRP